MDVNSSSAANCKRNSSGGFYSAQSVPAVIFFEIEFCRRNPAVFNCEMNRGMPAFGRPKADFIAGLFDVNVQLAFYQRFALSKLP